MQIEEEVEVQEMPLLVELVEITDTLPTITMEERLFTQVCALFCILTFFAWDFYPENYSFVPPVQVQNS